MINFVIFWIIFPLTISLAVVALTHFHPAFGQHVKGMFTDSQGKPSYTRGASFIAEIAVIAWATHIVWITNVIPDLWPSTIFIGAMFFLDRLPEIILAMRGGTLPKLDQPAQAPTGQQ